MMAAADLPCRPICRASSCANRHAYRVKLVRCSARASLGEVLGREVRVPEAVGSPVAAVLKARLVVGFLGERAQYDWWPTAFLTPSGRRFLEPVFTKTTSLAQYHAVVEAARRLHDEHLNVGSYHLFRLPEETEQDLHATQLRDLCDLQLKTKEEGLAQLEAMAAGMGKEQVGPVAVARITELSSAKVLASVVGTYLAAFKTRTKSFPYFLS